ncbi:unnamed protein product [Phytophthora fragariaefolia]|uniref:Unnamed protein product n=1 Tax=Phytophthora fragariaefolia TaxID=1490495 RepID=A0A9W7D8Y2_9STRA|nr:unnamed protein product [Phytophthora fragariaefolia]
MHRVDLRWGRLTFAQLRDEEFLAKQLRRIEITQGARRLGRPTAAAHAEAAALTGSSPEKTIRQRLQAAQAKAARGASDDDEFDSKEETLMTDMTLKQTLDGDAEVKNERELTNALCVLGNLQQPELAALMVTKLKEALRRGCSFPNPVYQLIGLRRQLMKSMHEAVAAQHRQRKAAIQLNIAIAKCMETSLQAPSDELQTRPADPVGLATGSVALKPKEKVTREAAMGIQVLVCLLSDLHDPAVTTLAQRREFLGDLLPLLSGMGFLALSPRRGLGGNSSGLGPSTGRGSSCCFGSVGPSPGAADVADFIEKLQRFLLDMCPRPTSIPSSSPKLPAITSGNGEIDVLDRTNAVNGLIHLAGATGSVRDFLVVLRVLLGAGDHTQEAVKEIRSSLSSRVLLTSSVPSLATVYKEELLSSPMTSGRSDGEAIQVHLKAKESDITCPDSSKPQKDSPRSKRETDMLGDTSVQDSLRRKALPKGLKAIGTNTTAGSTAVNLAMSHSSLPHHRLLYSTPGNNLTTKQRAKDEQKDSIFVGNASLSLDMSKMKETLMRDTQYIAMSTRSETPIVTARCPKFKGLNVQSVLVELDRAKPSAPMRAPRGKTSVSLQSSRAGVFSNDLSSLAGEEEEGDREVWSCGQNSYGELGHGDTASRKSFERIESLQQKDIIQIGAGNEHTIALTADGKVLTCGYNDNGQCGQGGTARVSHLSEMPKMGENVISQVHAYNGCEHTILVTMDGRAATCGYNYRGQLGHGNTASESVPKIVRSLENKIVRLVSCSYYHTVMACEEDGGGQQYLYTFGRNDYGQLGHNDSIDRKVPQHVEAMGDQHVISVACGQYHTMVVTAAGKTFAFGKNDYGQLGVDSMENQLVPVQVRAGLERQECLEIRCGYYHTIVLCSGAHLFGFGRNDYGQLGLGRSNASSTANLQLQQQRFSYARLIEELEGKDIVRFACGCYHTIAVSDNGVMYVFGRNNHGQLGTGDTNERVYPFPVDDFVGKRVALVVAGFYHTVVLTGGKDDEKSDQEAAGNEKGEVPTSISNSITYSEILSSAAVQNLLDPDKRPELENSSSLIKTSASQGNIESGVEAPAVDPTDDDFRDEDNHSTRNLNSGDTGYTYSTSKPPPDSTDALFIAVVILAQLDKFCQPFIPKPGSHPTMQHPTMSVIETLTATTGSSATFSLDGSCSFDGSFESFAIHNCSSTFDSIAALLKHLSTKKIEALSQLSSCLAPQPSSSTASTATPRQMAESNATGQLQLYMLLACIRILQANISQLLRSGMAKAVILLGITTTRKTSTSDTKPWAKEFDRIRVAILQVRGVLLSLIDIRHRRNVCCALDRTPNEGKNTIRVANEATITLMQGFELFFPCQCLQRQFCMHIMHEMPINETPEHSCGTLCRRELWSVDVLPKSKRFLLEPLLRRIAEDSLAVRLLPLVSVSPITSPAIPTSGQLPQHTEPDQISFVTEVYQLLLERTAADFMRRLGNAVSEQTTSARPRQDGTLCALFAALSGLQKHLSSWAASVHEWTLKDETEHRHPSIEIEDQIACIVDRAFRVDENDLERVPTPWRYFINFALATLEQCCEVLGHVLSMETLPSPTQGYEHRAEIGTAFQGNTAHSKMLDAVEHSIVGQFLPLLIVSLFEFSNNSLFAAALLPTLKHFLRLLDGLNQRDTAVEEAEKRFVESIASSLCPRPPQKESMGSFRRSNLISLASDDEGKSSARRTLTASDAMALPWHFRLEKELAVLTAEMAVTLVIGDPFFTYGEGKEGRDEIKLRERWQCSPLFRGGLQARYMTQGIKRSNSSKNARVIQHTPFAAPASSVPSMLGFSVQPHSLILPPSSGSDDAGLSGGIPNGVNYGEIFRPENLQKFLRLLQSGDSSDTLEKSTVACKLCDWIRDCYAKRDPPYRMIIRQSQLSINLKGPASSVERQIHENDLRIEAAFFAALLYHNMLVAQAYHFALGLNVSGPEMKSVPPKTLLNLWRCVAQLRRRIATKKTEIKNKPHPNSESPRINSFDQIIALQQTILDRCKLLTCVDVHEQQEHLNMQLDGGYVAPCDPAFLVSACSAFKFSASSVKRHLHTTYTDDKLPFLTGFPASKWRKVRILLHTMIRWRNVVPSYESIRKDVSSHVSQEILAYVMSDENVSLKTAVRSLLVDPCRRVSSSVRGLEALWELLTLVSFDSIQADIIHQVSQVFVFQSSGYSILAGSHNVGYFYSSLQSDAFSDFIGQLTEMMTDKAALLMEPGETDPTCMYWIVMVLLSAWGVHFNAEQFEFVSDIGILGVIQDMLIGLSSKRGVSRVGNARSHTPTVDSIVGRSGGQSTLVQFIIEKQLSRLEDTLWVLFRYIFVHFAVQIVSIENSNGACNGKDAYVPTFPVLSGMTDLLYSEAESISSQFLPLWADLGNISSERMIDTTPAAPAAVRRSFEVITVPHRFSSQSRGVTFSYDEMISPSDNDSITPMSPLTKPNEFSVTTWLNINTTVRPRSAEGQLYDLPQGIHDRQLVFIRGTGREISLYLVLVPESIDHWQLEVGILMDLNREADPGAPASEFAVKGRIWERILSKQAVPGGKWFHVAVVLEATKIRLYMNGVLDCQRSLATQSLPIWAAGSVNLPFHFGRFPSAPDSSGVSPTNSSAVASVFSAKAFLSRSLGIMKVGEWDPRLGSNNATERPLSKSGAFRCFDGWLCHFRFHNRSLSPIHVRIVFDEKKAQNGLLSDEASTTQFKVVEMHALLILLSSSSEGLMHFTSHFSKWMRLVWGTFLGAKSTVVQQSAIRVLCALLPPQQPLEASKVLVEDTAGVNTENLGFFRLEDVFVQQVIRIIGFCLSKCPYDRRGVLHQTAVIPWTLMIACGIHANQFSPEVRDNDNQSNEMQSDIELRYQTSKRQCLVIANELRQLLHQLFRSSNDAWQQSIISAVSTIAHNFTCFSVAKVPEQPESWAVQFGKYNLQLSALRCVESIGCLYFLGGGFEFLRLGATVEMRGSKKHAQVLSIEHHAPNSSQPETPSGTNQVPPAPETLVYVRINENSEVPNAIECDGSSTQKVQTWYDKVFSSSTQYNDVCPTYSKVNVEELNRGASNPNGSNNLYSSVIYDMASKQKGHHTFSVLLEKANEIIPLVYGGESIISRSRNTENDLHLMNVGCMLLKILTQIVGCTPSVDEVLSKSALVEVIAELAVKEDTNPKYDTLCHIEKRVSALRREIYAALVGLGEEGKSELTDVQQDTSKGDDNARYVHDINEKDADYLASRSTGRRSITQSQSDEVGLSVTDDGPDTENVDPTQSADRVVSIQDEDEGDDDGDDGEDEGDDDDGSLEDADNDEEEDDEAEETRAEFVEELMLMGFPEDWCVLALKQTDNDIVSASAWIVDNLEYLSKLQSTLDKERDRGRDSPRFDEDEDDVVPPDDAGCDSIDPPPLNSSNSWIESSAWKDADGEIPNSEPEGTNKLEANPSFVGGKSDELSAPMLNEKEMGRKLFGEMYFPFEDGGYLSNTKSRFMTTWRAEPVEMKVKATQTTPQPVAETMPHSPLEEDFQSEISKLDLRSLIEQLQQFETTLSILYARQFMVTLLHQATGKQVAVNSQWRAMISYVQWFKLLKLVLLRGDQFTIVLRVNHSNDKPPKLQELSAETAFSRAVGCFVGCDAAAFTASTFELCLGELEAAAANKAYEAVLWTQRDLQRSDKTVVEEPGIEIVVWMFDFLTENNILSFPGSFAKTVLRRLRCCLGTANLPLKFVIMRIMSRLLLKLQDERNGSPAKHLLKESQLLFGDFLSAAVLRHTRELAQGRLLFSQYLQGYVELLHVLQSLTDFGDVSIAQHLANFCNGSGENLPHLLVSLLPPTAPTYPKTEGSSLCFDRKRSRSSLLTFADDGLSVSYSGNEVWKAACAVVSFSTGVHSWMVRVEKSSSPYIFVGVATRQANLDSFLGADDQSWGFIGDKALYYQRNRVRAYGETFTEGDCIGLRLDCEKGELSFSKNGVDLGVAFDNIVGEVCPAVAFYSRQQKISFVKDSCVSCIEASDSEITSTGEERGARVEECLIACEIMSNWVVNKPMSAAMLSVASKMTSEWLAGTTKYVTTRSGKSLWVDITRETCGKLGFYCDDRVRTPRGNGVVVGAAAGRVWVEVDNEPGAWYFHPSKLRLMTLASSTTSALPVPPAESGLTFTDTSRPPTALSISNEGDTNKNAVTSEGQVPSFTLSPHELVEYGEHPMWSISVDKELLSVINEFCEVSRINPWNLTPKQLLTLIKEKTPILELTSLANVLVLPQNQIDKLIVARFALLRFCNVYVSRALPFFDLTWHYFLPKSNSLPCRLVSQCRGSLFVCVKNLLWTTLMERTANSPKRADDEYDYPEDLPQLQVNRLKAAAAKCHEGTISSLFLSLFGQAFEELHFLPLKTLRMVYSHPMDDGQLRSFKVKFEGEGVDDYGGPYREFFSQFFAELQMLHVPEAEGNSSSNTNNAANGGPSSTSLKLDPSVSVSECVLPFLLPSPNWRNGVGANREKFVLNGALISQNAGDRLNYSSNAGRARSSPGESFEEKRQLYCEMFYFLGQMIGTCLRTRVCVRLDLAMSVWKQLVAEDVSNPESALETLKEIDFVAYSLWKTLRGILDELKCCASDDTGASKRHELEEQLDAMDLVFTTVLSDGRAVELCDDGTNLAVTPANLEQYLDAMLQARMQETEEVMNIVKQGLHSIMPVSGLSLLTWSELEKRMCGVAEVDVKLLQANTEYDEELSPNDEFIQRFWRVLESLESEDKRAFLRFVWARSRLPLGSAQFHQKFKIQALASSGTGEGGSSAGGATVATGSWMDSQMPKSHTCFFALQLPRYSTDEICRERLLYAVRNCVEMDGDFRLADTEMTGWTGISPTDQLRI